MIACVLFSDAGGYNLVMHYAQFLDEVRPEHVGQVGAKAATLARLRQQGLPVSSGFVVPASLFDLIAAQAGLNALLGETEPSVADDPAQSQPSEADDSAQSERIAAALARVRVPVEAIDALHLAFDRVLAVSGAVVVRSSAIGEDLPTASSAGQYQTILNVRDFPGFFVALRQCWLSLFSPAALGYRRRLSETSAPRMAVLVQAQIASEVAGTMFTVNPLNGADQIVIEATWGLGEAIAQGEVVPDRYVLDPTTLAELAGTRVAEKLSQRVPGGKNGTRLASVPEWRQRVPTLDRSERATLALLGLRVAAALGAPQDVEWGRAAGHWWIFQSRPITTLPAGAVPVHDPSIIGPSGGETPRSGPTRPPQPPANHVTIGERSSILPPAVASPRTAASAPSLDRLGSWPTRGFAAYRNLGLGEERATLAPSGAEGNASDACARWDWTSGFLDERLVEPVSPLGWSVLREGLEEVAFAEPLGMLGVDPDALRPLTRLWNGHPYANVAVYEALYKLFPDWLLPEDARRFFPGGDPARRERAPRPRGLLDSRVWVGLLRAIWRYPTIVSPFQNDGAWERFLPAYEAAIERLGRRVDGYEQGATITLGEVLALLRAIEEQNRALLRIHRWSLTFAELWYSLLRRVAIGLIGSRNGADLAVAAVSSLNDQSMRLNQSLAELRQRLAEGSSLEVVLPEFLRQYGHRSFSLDLMRPPFAADAAQVLALIEPPSGPPTRLPTASTRASFGLAGWLLRPLAELARRYARLRENQRFAWQRGLALARRLYLLAGRVLVERGALNRAEDVFFLTADEVRRAETTQSDFHLIVGARFEALAAQQDLFLRLGRESYPPFLQGNRPRPTSEPPAAPGPVAPRSGVVELTGVPVSSGIGRGPARIILRASDLATLCSGEVLVARGADPGWTTVFDRLAGLVAESGGQLSHASVVAREYHLPAVVAVPRATDLIRTGDEVELDGQTGTVRVRRGNGPLRSDWKKP